MYDIDRDSLVPIHEQIAGQIAAHIATGALHAGTVLPEYRAFAQELLTNPQAVTRAYAELEREQVLGKTKTGEMFVAVGAAAICQTRLRQTAYERLRGVVAFALGCGMSDVEIAQALERALGACKMQPLAPNEILNAIRLPTHDSSHRASEGIQVLPRQGRPGPT
jgi:DNA-binding transcriptional regulator YhcF (GntR family)